MAAGGYCQDRVEREATDREMEGDVNDNGLAV